MRSRRQAAAGLSLVELVVGLAILGLVLAAVSSLVFGALGASSHQRDKAALTQAAQRALERMASFARETDLVSVPQESQPIDNELTVTDRLLGTGEDVSFYLDPDERCLMEDGPSGTQVLAANVDLFQVTRTPSSGSQPLLTIELGLSRHGVSVWLATTVLPRNDPAWFEEEG